jgi:hypothetical protein
MPKPNAFGYKVCTEQELKALSTYALPHPSSVASQNETGKKLICSRVVAVYRSVLSPNELLCGDSHHTIVDLFEMGYSLNPNVKASLFSFFRRLV